MTVQRGAVALAIIWTVLGVISVTAGQLLLLSPPGASVQRRLGSATVLSCEVINYMVESDDEDVDYDITWFGPDGSEITDTTDSGRIIVTKVRGAKKTLAIMDTQVIDEGRYTCSTTIGDQQTQKTTTLMIVEEISFGDTPTTQYIEAGGNDLIRCDVTGIPKPKVSWRFNGRRIVLGGATSRYELKPNGLMIKDVTSDDNGVYTCRAEVESQFVYRDLYISVTVSGTALTDNE